MADKKLHELTNQSNPADPDLVYLQKMVASAPEGDYKLTLDNLATYLKGKVRADGKYYQSALEADQNFTRSGSVVVDILDNATELQAPVTRTGPGQFQISTTGRYKVKYHLKLYSDSAGNTNFKGKIILNSATEIAELVDYAVTQDNLTRDSAGESCYLTLTAGDELQLEVETLFTSQAGTGVIEAGSFISFEKID